jgi:hypothetical protein
MVVNQFKCFFPILQRHDGSNSRFFVPAHTAESRSCRTRSSRDRWGAKTRPAQQEARTMRPHPLIAYSSLIRGGLHLIPGGFDPPAHKRFRPKDLSPDPFSPSPTLAARFADAVGPCLRNIYAAFFSRAVAPAQPEVTKRDQAI